MREFKILEEDNLDGKFLIEASAGTGKTFTLSLLVIRLLIEKRLLISEIVVVTFTNAATGELKERISKFLIASSAFLKGKVELADNPVLTEYLTRYNNNKTEIIKIIDDAIITIDEASIFSIHGFCQRINNEFAIESGVEFGRELLTDMSDIVIGLRDNFWRKEILTLPKDIYRIVINSIKSPEKLHSMIDSALKFQEIKLVNSVENMPQNSDLDSLYNKRRMTLLNIKTEWESYSNEISDIIREAIESKNLKNGSYKPTFVTEDFIKITEFLSSIGDDDGELKLLKKLSTSSLVNSTKKNGITPKHSFFDYIESTLETLNNINHNISKFNELIINHIVTKYFTYTKTALTKEKERNNIFSYDDIISSIYFSVKDNNKKSDKFIELINQRYKVALVDEFQDTDEQQFTIFDRIFGSKTLFMIGDPKQAIYRFRGGDVHAYLNVHKDKYIKIFTLTENFRSQEKLIDNLNELFKISDNNPFLSDDIPYHKIKTRSKREPITLNKKEIDSLVIFDHEKFKTIDIAEREIYKNIANEIVTLLSNNYEIGDKGNRSRVKAKDIAILVQTNKQARAIKDILKEHQIPAVTLKSGNIFESEEAKYILHILEALNEPSNTGIIRSLLFTPLFSKNISDIDKQVIDTISRFENYRKEWLERGILISLNSLFDNENILQSLLSDTIKRERITTNYRHLFEILNSIEMETGILPERLINSFKDSVQNRDGDEYEQRLETDEENVQIVTIYTSKGLEYPILFFPLPWQLIEKDKRCKESLNIYHENDSLVLNIKIGDNFEIAQQELNEEKQRLFYVALTRASQRLYIFNTTAGSTFKSSLIPTKRFIDPLKDRNKQPFKPFNNVDTPILLNNKVLSTNIFSNKTFEASISKGDTTKSYSSIMLSPPHIEKEKSSLLPTGIFAFVKGARTGEAWHKIFEEITYNNSDTYDYGIKKGLLQYGFNPEKVDTDSVTEMVNNVMEITLDNHNGTPFSLNSINRTNYITELEFLLKAESVDPEIISNIILENEGFEVSVKDRDFSGFLTGFIDLVAINDDGQYFVIDWKSNHLGNSYSDYSYENITGAMIEHEYRLQYILYIVALSKLLMNQTHKFKYEEHIGGAYYFFLRGIEPTQKTGLYYHRPKEKTISELLNHFLKEN